MIDFQKLANSMNNIRTVVAQESLSMSAAERELFRRELPGLLVAPANDEPKSPKKPRRPRASNGKADITDSIRSAVRGRWSTAAAAAQRCPDATKGYVSTTLSIWARRGKVEKRRVDGRGVEYRLK